MFRVLSFVIVFWVCSVAFVNAQTKYPVEIMPNESKTFSPERDTLWVLTNRQVKRAITDAKKLQLELQISQELRNRISLMEDKSLTKDSLVLDLTEDRNYYMNNWNECKDDVKVLIAKNKRRRLFTRLSLAGVVVAFVAGFLIAK